MEERKNREMEEIREVALAFYKHSPEELQKFAKDFFRDLDKDGDGKISLHEFMRYVMKNCKSLIKKPTLFKELDTNGDGYLNFEEVIVFYYIINTRRYCDNCENTLTSTYFTCSECYRCFNNNTYSLCLSCYDNEVFKYTHEQHQSLFLDNYAIMWWLQQNSVSQDNGKANTNNQSSSSVNNKNEVVPYQKSRRERAKESLAIGAHFATIGAAAFQLQNLLQCSIM